MYIVLYVVMYRQLGTNLVVPGGARVIEAKGRLVMPGMTCYTVLRLFTQF